MSRPLSWYPLASSDPVPGDPGVVRAAGERYREVARAISRAAGDLRAIADVDGTLSYAVDQVREKATEVAGDIERAHDRYDRVGAALVEYASALDTAQSESAAALSDAQAAQSAIDSAGTSIVSASRAVNDATEDDEKALHQSRLARARASRDEAEARLAAARRRLEEAVSLRDSAARTAVGKVDDVTGTDGLKDNLWEDLNLGAIVKAISDVAGIIASVAGVLALVLCWVPVLGQALAAVALIASAVKLVADISLLASGEGSWSDVIWGVVAVASFGVGRVLSIAAQGATRGAAGMARLSAGRIGAMSKADRAARGFPTTSAASVIRSTAGPSNAALSRGAARAMVSRMGVQRWLTEGLRSLTPTAVAAEARQAGRFLHDGAAWSNAMSQARSSFGAAGSNPMALFAASQADDALVHAVRATDEIAPVLRAEGDVARALGNALAWQSGSTGMVATGAYDTTVGLQPTFETLVDGAPLEMPVIGSVQSVVDWFGPSPAEQLNLTR